MFYGYSLSRSTVKSKLIAFCGKQQIRENIGGNNCIIELMKAFNLGFATCVVFTCHRLREYVRYSFKKRKVPKDILLRFHRIMAVATLI